LLFKFDIEESKEDDGETGIKDIKELKDPSLVDEG
jgi:hypothetical protein